jgi:hypothetical protein
MILFVSKICDVDIGLDHLLYLVFGSGFSSFNSLISFLRSPHNEKQSSNTYFIYLLFILNVFLPVVFLYWGLNSGFYTY